LAAWSKLRWQANTLRPVLALMESSRATSKRPSVNGFGIARHSTCQKRTQGSFTDAMKV
jgi:hypothetical protein